MYPQQREQPSRDTKVYTTRERGYLIVLANLWLAKLRFRSLNATVAPLRLAPKPTLIIFQEAVKLTDAETSTWFINPDSEYFSLHFG